MIPTLITEAGVPVWESNAVVRFIDEAYSFADDADGLDPAALALQRARAAGWMDWVLAGNDYSPCFG